MSDLYYLASPIDQARGVWDLAGVLARVLNAGEALDMSFYQPATAYSVADTLPAGPIDTINGAALDAAAGLVAVLPRGVPTLGTPVEVERVRLSGRPVLLVVTDDLDRASVQVAAWAQDGRVMVVHGDRVPDGLRWLREAARERRGMPTRVGPTGTFPNRAYPDDAGLDLVCSDGKTIDPGEAALIPTSVGMAIPTGYVGLILGRSSAWAKRGLIVIPGVIDAGWRGDLFVSVWLPADPHLPIQPVEIKPGDRLAQILILPVWLGGLALVPELPPHPRGLNGFGSSGS